MGTVIELIDPNFCAVNFAVVTVLFLSLFYCFFVFVFFLFFCLFFCCLVVCLCFCFSYIHSFKGRGERVNLKNAQSDQFNQKLLSFA